MRAQLEKAGEVIRERFRWLAGAPGRLWAFVADVARFAWKR